MIKKLIKFLFFIIITITIITIYLSIFGINTKQFNNKIKSEILNINDKVNLELKTVKFLLNLSDLSINIKTQNPEIFIYNNKLELEYIKTNVSLRSFINKEFTIDDLQISTKAIKLNDIILLVRSIKNSAELIILDNIIKDGFLVGEINLNFDNNGQIKDDYEIKGFIKKGKLDIFKKYSIDDLNLIFNVKDKEYHLRDLEGVFNQVKLFSESIKIKEKINKFLVKGRFINKKDDITFNTLNDLLRNSLKNQAIEAISFSSNNAFSFIVNKNFKISNFNLKSKINLDSLLYKKKLPALKKYLPNFKDMVKLENHKILVNYKNNKLDINGNGKISINNETDHIDYELNKEKNNYRFNTTIKINKNYLLLDAINYKKKNNIDSILKVKGSYKKNKKINFETISLIDAEKNNFLIKNLILNNKFKIIDIDELHLKFINNNKIKNKVSLKKNKKKYEIYGESLDFSKVIDELLNTNNDGSFSLFSNLNSKIVIKIDKTYLDKDTFINDLTGNIFFQKNKINTLNLNSTFPNKKKLTLTIITNNNDEKITTLVSGNPEPLVKNYKFIKGFEGGILDFYSIKKNGISNSVLNIDNFKIKEVPALAKLLTLASLQGISDLLTGEGIRFTNFEMKFSNEKTLMKIEEMYAIGPAISILMDGYIESNKLVSLRGTLVPATTINRSIASIPLIGKILVGKKIGEGVFGVSFKIKGSPNNVKTTVNPIKTLTPRFITRTLEKIKKN